MSTRLDRLLLLLETGSTTSIRSSAASQLGSIVAQHPSDLHSLLNRLAPLLRAKSWETRSASAEAIESLAQNTPSFESVSTGLTNVLDELFEFESFDIQRVIDFGTKLLGSSGTEYEQDWAGIDSKERLALYKKQLKTRLGFASIESDDLWDEADFKAPKPVEVKPEVDPLEGLSAREKNRLKRLAKRGKPEDMSVDVAVSKKRKTLDHSVVVVQSKKQDQVPIDEWPFEGLCEMLQRDLFSPAWETRHGACLGLKSVLKHQFNGAGKIMGLSNENNTTRHSKWLEDLAVQLICVLSLDRFADYVGDHVVVPVRESCAQTLATLVQQCDVKLALDIINRGILPMITSNPSNKEKWQVRHSGLIALKYWMAVRSDLVPSILKDASGELPAFGAILSGLSDADDDIRSVSAAALLPVSDALVDIFTAKKVFEKILKVLCASLQDLDDLTASTSFVMDLMANFITHEKVAAVIQTSSVTFLESLVPLLFPFFRHNITSVRTAVLKTLTSLVRLAQNQKSHQAPSWIHSDLIRLICQNFCLEEKAPLLDLSTQLIQLISSILTTSNIQSNGTVLSTALPPLLALVSSPIGVPLNSQLFVHYASANAGMGSIISANDKGMFQQDLTIVSEESVLQARLLGCKALGQLLAIPSELKFDLNELLSSYLASSWASHRYFLGLVLFEWGLESGSGIDDSLIELITQQLNDANEGAMVLYSEITESFTTLYKGTLALHKAMESIVGSLPPMPPLPGTDIPSDSSLGPVFTADVSHYLAIQLFDEHIIPRSDQVPVSLMEQRQLLLDRMTAFSLEEDGFKTRVLAALSATLISFDKLPLKLNPLVRSLMNSIKVERNPYIRERVATAFAKLLQLNLRNPKLLAMNDKIVKNLAGILCSDPFLVKDPSRFTENSGILSISPKEQVVAKTKGKKVLELDLADDLMDGGLSSNANDEASVVASLGAKACLLASAQTFGPDLFTNLSLLQLVLDPLKSLCTQKSLEVTQARPLIDALFLLENLAEMVHASLYPVLLPLVKNVASCLCIRLSAVRYHAARALGSLCKCLGASAMMIVLSDVVPFVSDLKDEIHRQGAIECIYQISRCLEESILPYLVFLIVPLLGRMSDSDEHVRYSSTHVFAQLVKLAPLESGVADPLDFTPDMSAKKIQERKFIGQLIGSERIQEFSLPIKIDAELRTYQKEGVNWLGFLNRYGLHGILCDGVFESC